MAVNDIFRMVSDFKISEIAKSVKAEIDAGIEISTILNEGLVAAMDEVGSKFSEGKLFVPEMMAAAQTMKAGLEVLKPHFIDSDAKPKGTIIIGTVKGDLHDIGKNLVGMMLEGAGFKIIDLGVDREVDSFYSAAIENNAEIIALSALLTTTMPAMQDTVAYFKDKSSRVKIMVGGAPITEDFAKKIKADGYSDDAAGAVKVARQLIEE
jgi:5-methyltetrahydrofolate--homocysteine methyltransferase